MDEERDDQWHLDKRVPLGLVMAILVQTVVFIYFGTSWKADTDHRLAALEKSSDAQLPQGNRLLILEQKFEYIRETLTRIEQKINREATP